MIGYIELAAGAALILLEVYLILVRNRTILFSGKDDLMLSCIVILLATSVLVPDQAADQVTAAGSMVLLAACLFSLAVRRGVSARGIEKFGYFIPWSSVKSLTFEDYQMDKIRLNVKTERWKSVLIFRRRDREALSDLLKELSGLEAEAEIR